MQKDTKAENLLSEEKQREDVWQQKIDDARKKYVANGLAIGMCVGVVGGMFFIFKYGVTAVIIGTLIGTLVGARIGMEVFKNWRKAGKFKTDV